MNKENSKNIFEGPFPELFTERITLREFNMTDVDDLLEIRSDDSVMKYMDTNYLKSKKEAEQFLIKIVNGFREKKQISWVLEHRLNKKFMGYIGLFSIDYKNNFAETGYALKPDYQGNGYMREALKEIIRFSFEQLKFHRLEANVNPENLSSIKLLEKLNFRREAHFRENYFFGGKYLDSVIYGLLEKDI